MTVSSLAPDHLPDDALPTQLRLTDLPLSAESLTPTPESPNRSFIVTWLLSLTLGFLGADRFFTGRWATGVL